MISSVTMVLVGFLIRACTSIQIEGTGSIRSVGKSINSSNYVRVLYVGPQLGGAHDVMLYRFVLVAFDECNFACKCVNLLYYCSKQIY